MRLEKFLTDREQPRVQNALYARQVDLRIFGVRVVAVDQQSPQSQQKQEYCRLVLNALNVGYSFWQQVQDCARLESTTGWSSVVLRSVSQEGIAASSRED